MSERRPDPPDIRASLVDSGWSEPEAQPERVLPKYEDAPRDLLVTRVDDQIQSRLDAMRRSGSDPGFDVPTAHGEPTSDPPRPSQEQTLDQMAPFVPMPSLPLQVEVNPFRGGPSVREALAQRVSIVGAELPLWGFVAALLGVTALVTSLLTLAFADSAADGSAPAAAASAVGANSPTRGAESSSLPGAQTGAKPSGNWVERAAAGDPDALATLERKRPRELKAEEALALASGRATAAATSARKLRERLGSDPGLAKDPKVVVELLKFAQSPETSREALMAMAALPGPISADLLYEVWTGTAQRSDSTELARSLLLGPDVRPRASPALGVALDLREAEACEDSAKILPRAADVGDKRSYAPLSRLMRRTGCGPGKKQDCYPCLRENDELLRKAMQAVKLRREPDFLPK